MSKETPENTKVEKPKKKGTPGTEVIIGSAANVLKKAVDNIKSAVSDVDQLVAKAEEQQGIIAQREERIAELDVEFKEKKRQKDVELEDQLRESKRDTVDKILGEQNLVAIDKVEHAKLTGDIQQIKVEAQNEASRATAIATSNMKKEHENAMALQKAGFERDQAENKAKLDNANSQIEFLREQCKKWEEALNAERQASVERSKANAIGTITVGNTGK
jgi:chromosome segregation ATPase